MAQNYITRGFWGDEAWTSLISQLPFAQMLKTTAADFHPPAYYTVIELWYKIFPPTEVSTRIVSFIFYLLTIFLVYRLVYFIADSTSDESKPFDKTQGKPTSDVLAGDVTRKKRFWGILSAAVVAVNPIFFQYAFEARNYTMFAFAATGSVYFLIKISQAHFRSEPRFDQAHSGSVMLWNYVGFVLFTALGMYTHYYMFFTVAAQGLFILLFDRRILLKMIGVYFAVGVLYLPWIPFLFSQVTSVGESYWISPIGNRTHYEALLRILGGEQPNVLQIWLFRFSFILVLAGLIQHLRQKSFEKPYILIWLWAIVPFVLATLPGFKIDGFQFPFRPIFYWRYLIGAAVPLSLVIVHASQKLPRVRMFAVFVVIVLSLIVDLWTLGRYTYGFKQVYETDIVGEINKGDKIVTILPSFAESLYYRNYFGLENEVIVLPEGLVQFSGKSLLDAYVANGVVTIADAPESGYFELRQGPSIRRME